MLMAELGKHSEERKTEDKEWFQIVAIIIVGLNGFSYGLFFAWSSPSIPKIVADNHYHISLEQASYFTVIAPIGAITSSFLAAKLNDTIGRRKTLLLITIPHIISWILIASSTSLLLLYTARFISGVADAFILTSVPTYVGEISTPKVRGTWGNLMTFYLYLGLFVINALGSFFSITTAALICLLVPVFFFCTFIFMPESPYFYLMHNKIEDARNSLQKLRRREDVEDELWKLKEDVERQMSEAATWKDVFTIASNRRAFFAGVFLRSSQQFGGVAAFAIYTKYIFSKSGGSVSATTSSLIFTGLNTVLNLMASFTLDKFGRRKSYFYSTLLCFCALVIETIYFTIEQFLPQVPLDHFRWIPLAGMIFYIVAYSFGMGIVPTLMLGELFSTSIKGKGLCLMNVVFAVLISTTTKLFLFLDTSFGLFAPFMFFAICTFFSTILSLYFVPETSGMTLEEIQQTLKDKGTSSKKC